MSNIDVLLGKKISCLNKDIRYFLQNKLNNLHLGSSQFILVLKVHDNEGISQDELSKMLNIDKTTTAKSVKKILNEGYIEKRKDKRDKRSYKLYITKKGKEVYPQIAKIFDESETIFRKGFSDEELNLFISFLERVKNNIKD